MLVRAIALSTAVLAGTASVLPAQDAPPTTEAPQFDVLLGLQYASAGGQSLLLDLYRPRYIDAPLPVVAFVHGGGWKNGSRKSAAKQAQWLVRHGFAVASIDYRLTDVAQWPAQIDDCYAAVRWLRGNAAKYRLDPAHIGAWGTSAGGHLVALMGTRHADDGRLVSSRVQAVCDWFGPSDLLSMPPNVVGHGRTKEDVARSNGAKLLGAAVRDLPDKARDASARHHAGPDACPFLIMHGDQDPGVPLQQSVKLHQKLLAAGASSQLQVIAGAGHGGKQFSAPATRQVVLRFFTETLKPRWHQGAGPAGNFAAAAENVPTHWSVVRNQNIGWQHELPETGQSTVAIWGDRLFFTTMAPVDRDSELGSDIVAWCMDQRGNTLWQRPIEADHPLRLSGCFSDSTGPPPVTDGTRVVFFNASGRISCFDFEGRQLWTRELMAVGRSQPLLLDGNVVFIKQTYMPNAKGHFTHEHKNAPLDQWTQLQALDIRTGEPAWNSVCGVNMGSVPLAHVLPDGRRVILVGRGGGHSPPEPDGISMIDAANGHTIWTLPLAGFMSTMTMNVYGSDALVFHGGEHLWVDVATGKIRRRASFVDEVDVRIRSDKGYLSVRRSTEVGKNLRSIIQQSNMLAGPYHYFRHYTQPWLGRIHAETGNVEYLQLPVQLSRSAGDDQDRLIWDPRDLAKGALVVPRAGKPRKDPPITRWAFQPNSMTNSRGFVVMGDARSQGNGWGHHATAVPTVVGDYLFVPVMSGTVYVLRWNAATLDERAVVAVNDLGPAGGTWTRASLSYAGGRLLAHTIDRVICIESAGGAGKSAGPQPVSAARSQE